ncbi:unnamed protein product [Sphagnum troendelagicum]
MAWQKMALLAVAGVLCMSALLNEAEVSASASNPPLRNATQASGVMWQFRSIFQWNINLGKHRISPCRDKNGNSHFTELDLNPHLPNINGVLELGSNYIETCTSQGGREEGSSFTFADRRQGNGNVVPTSFNVNNNVANINGELEWLNCNQLLAMDEIAAADEDVALSGRKLLNH